MIINDGMRRSYACFVVGVLAYVPITRPHSYIWKISKYTFRESEIVLIPLLIISYIINITGMQYQNDCDNAKYSASLVIRDIWVCSLYAHTIEHPAYIIV